MKIIGTISFSKLPKSYDGLCKILLPRHISDGVAYENTVHITDSMAGYEDQMTIDQQDYFDTLCTLISEYERSLEEKTPKPTSNALLQHLAEEHQMTGANLAKILGKSASLGRSILRGDREITLDHAKCLGEYFTLPPALFLKM